MRTYYRGPDAFVTADRFVWLTETPKIVPIRELRDIGLVQHLPRRRPADAAVAVSAGLGAFAAAGWLTLGIAAGAGVSVLAVLAMTVALRTRRSRGTRTFRVVATVNGIRTMIYEARDLRVFNQVTRALRRSVEDDRRSHAGYGLAAAS